MTATEIKLAAKLLDVASNSFANHGCNDFDMSFLSVEERHEIMMACFEWQGDSEGYDANQDYKLWIDWILMRYVSEKLMPNQESKIQGFRRVIPDEIDLPISQLKEWATGRQKFTLEQINKLIISAAKNWHELKYK
ncbi:hypothetical protein FD723_40730 (plasmid) [Nostoc sp. C052]|uniref:hypothetical protein n=1 Tax=Nostoc sp. C052 TaxID=2576902 RepID=UPI0015C33252|nr:hypothetical protein [Nostoc sp. C052]QLE46541.1 hypothetical protein FD723_40730 [Nostoc sp. C052]